MTLAEILLLPAASHPRMIFATDQGAFFIIPATETGMSARPSAPASSTPQTCASQSTSLDPAHANGYLRFSYTADKAYTVTSGDALPIGSIITLRNAVVTGDLWVIPDDTGTDVIIHGEETAFIIPPLGTGQLVKVALNTWDLV